MAPIGRQCNPNRISDLPSLHIFVREWMFCGLLRVSISLEELCCCLSSACQPAPLWGWVSSLQVGCLAELCSVTAVRQHWPMEPDEILQHPLEHLSSPGQTNSLGFRRVFLHPPLPQILCGMWGWASRVSISAFPFFACSGHWSCRSLGTSPHPLSAKWASPEWGKYVSKYLED